MSLPFFYHPMLITEAETCILQEESSRHIAQVLRMKSGEQLQLTDGKGMLVLAEILDAHKKKTVVRMLEKKQINPPANNRTIAISPVKNAARFEWFLEKSTEIGVRQIIPLICQRTEKQHLRMDRLQGILISAMLQSQQCHLPLLHEPTALSKLLLDSSLPNGRYIAHCLQEGERKSFRQMVHSTESSIILIGPEGDFTFDEIQQSFLAGYTPVSLGEQRLRTETAGVVAAVLGLN
jgi:16S rRNA (uracil1498-N3)-methyltransferase